jgi:hypothetical protein
MRPATRVWKLHRRTNEGKEAFAWREEIDIAGLRGGVTFSRVGTGGSKLCFFFYDCFGDRKKSIWRQFVAILLLGESLIWTIGDGSILTNSLLNLNDEVK